MHPHWKWGSPDNPHLPRRINPPSSSISSTPSASPPPQVFKANIEQIYADLPSPDGAPLAEGDLSDLTDGTNHPPAAPPVRLLEFLIDAPGRIRCHPTVPPRDPLADLGPPGGPMFRGLYNYAQRFGTVYKLCFGPNHCRGRRLGNPP